MGTDDDSSTPSTETPRSERLQRLQARTRFPSYLNLSNIVALMGAAAFLSYVAMYTYSSAFLGVFGTSPEELGIDKATMVVRAAVYGILIIGIMTFVVASALGLGAGMLRLIWAMEGHPGLMTRIRNYPRAETESAHIRRLRSIIFIVVVLCSAVTALLFSLSEGSFGDGTTFVLMLICLLAGFTLLARWRIYIVFIAAILITLAAAGTLIQISATHSAEALKNNRQIKSIITPDVAGIDVHRVSLSWPDEASPYKGIPSNLTLLGRANGIYVLSDPVMLYRIPVASVMLMEVE
jgi:hypothetical protein